MRKFLQEFKAFAMRGNVIDMAVGVIIGSAVTAIVNSLSVFLFVKLLNAAKERGRKAEAAAEAAAPPRLCPYCRSEIAEDATRCPHCTSILEEK